MEEVDHQEYLLILKACVWEALGRVALLEDMCPWWWALRFQKGPAVTNVLLPPGCGLSCGLSAIPALVSWLHGFELSYPIEPTEA